MSDQPDPVDVQVGERMRVLRKTVGMSQGALAEQLGITFQQVQKYERGTNRVSASMLYRAATALKVPVAVFFEGLPQAGGATKLSEINDKAVAAATVVPAIVKLPDLDTASRSLVQSLIEKLSGSNVAVGSVNQIAAE